MSTIIYIQYSIKSVFKLKFTLMFFIFRFDINVKHCSIFSNKNHGLQKEHIWKSYSITFYTHDVTCNLSRWNNERIDIYKNEVRNSRVRNSSWKIELCKMTSHFELLIQKFLFKFFSRVINAMSWKIILNLELAVTNSKV